MNDKLLLELKEYITSYLVLAQSDSIDSNVINSEAHDFMLMEPEEKYEEAIHRKRMKPKKTYAKPMSLQKCFVRESEKDIEDYIRKTKSEETFSSKLLKYIDLTGLSDAEIYKRAGIDRRHFSKIRCDKEYKPKKATVVALCLALKLGLGQVDELLELAGYSLSLSDTGDLVVKFCIEKEIYDLMDVNEAWTTLG